jgi:hypothetical protein
MRYRHRWLAVRFFNIATINVPKPVLGIGALLLIVVMSSSPVLLLLEMGQRAKPPIWYFKYFGFWPMAVAYAVTIAALDMMVLHELILPPAFIDLPFMEYLPWVGVSAMTFALFASAIWLVQVGQKVRRDFHHWLKTGEL